MDHGDAFLLRDGLIMLAFALGFVLLFRRLGLGATLGYLVAGAMIGPHVLGLVGGARQMMVIAELGIVMLLFVVGLELNPSRLWRLRKEIFGFGVLQVVLCGLAVTVMVAVATQFTWAAALVIGLPLALSSTAQVLPMLQSAGRLRTPFGERAFAILLLQDLSLIPLLTIVAALSRDPAATEGPSGWQLALLTLATIAGLIAAGRFLIRPLFHLIGRLGEREFFIVAALFTVVGAAALMQSLGLSAALGAFIAGVMLADTPYRHELEADVEPFRSILLGLFFLAVGMMLDLGAIAQRPFFVVGMAAALIVVKTGVIFGIALLFRMRWRSALALGLLLSQGGEFGFVLFAQAQSAMLIEQEAASLFGAIVTLSMAATPFLMLVTARIRKEPKAPRSQETREEPDQLDARAIVVGYGRFGQTVTQMLYSAGLSVTIIDRDVEMIDLAQSFGAKIYFGDGNRLDLLRQAGAAQAQAIFFCSGRDTLEPDFITSVNAAFPGAAIYLRTYDRRSLLRFLDTPAVYVMRETHESAIALSRMALEQLGIDEAEIDEAEDRFRASDTARLKEQSAAGSMEAARDRILTRPHRPNDGLS